MDINGLHLKDEGGIAPAFRAGLWKGQIYVWRRDDTVPAYAPGYHAYRPIQPPCRSAAEAYALLRRLNKKN